MAEMTQRSVEECSAPSNNNNNNNNNNTDAAEGPSSTTPAVPKAGAASEQSTVSVMDKCNFSDDKPMTIVEELSDNKYNDDEIYNLSNVISKESNLKNSLVNYSNSSSQLNNIDFIDGNPIIEGVQMRSDREDIHSAAPSNILENIEGNSKHMDEHYDTSTDKISARNTSELTGAMDEESVDYEVKRRQINEELAAMSSQEDKDTDDNVFLPETAASPHQGQTGRGGDATSEDDEEKEEGELDDDEEQEINQEDKPKDVEEKPIEDVQPSLKKLPLSVDDAKKVDMKLNKTNSKAIITPCDLPIEEVKEDKKRKKDGDDENERKKKKKKKLHFDSEEDSDEASSKFHGRTAVPSGSSDFDSMLQLELRRAETGVDYRAAAEFESEVEDAGPAPCRGAKRRGRRSPLPSSKTEALCVHFLEGTCTKGNECQYSHNVNHNMVIQPHLRKLELCKFYMMKCCAKRQKCLYMHKDFPCKHYHTGMKCVTADKCQFSHGPLTSVTRSILIKHLELAPKDILGSFPRLNRSAAQLIVQITELYRRHAPIDDKYIPALQDWRAMGFKYVDRALKAHHRKQRKEAKSSSSVQPSDGGQHQSDEEPAATTSSVSADGDDPKTVPSSTGPSDGAPLPSPSKNCTELMSEEPRVPLLGEVVRGSDEKASRRHKNDKKRYHSGHGEESHSSEAGGEERNRRHHDSRRRKSRRDRQRHDDRANNSEDTNRADSRGSRQDQELSDQGEKGGEEFVVRHLESTGAVCIPDRDGEHTESQSPERSSIDTYQRQDVHKRSSYSFNNHDEKSNRQYSNKNSHHQNQHLSEFDSPTKKRSKVSSERSDHRRRGRGASEDGGLNRHLRGNRSYEDWYSSEDGDVHDSGAGGSKSPRLMMDIPEVKTTYPSLLVQIRKGQSTSHDSGEEGQSEDNRSSIELDGRYLSQNIVSASKTSAIKQEYQKHTRNSVSPTSAPIKYDPLQIFREQQKIQRSRELQEEGEKQELISKRFNKIDRIEKPQDATTAPAQYVSGPAIAADSAIYHSMPPSTSDYNSRAASPPPATSLSTPLNSGPGQQSPAVSKSSGVNPGLLNLNLNNINVPSDLIKVLSDLKNQSTKLFPRSVSPTGPSVDLPTGNTSHRDPRQARAQRDSIESRDSANSRDQREAYKDLAEARDSRDLRELRNSRDPRETGEISFDDISRDPRDKKIFDNSINIKDPRKLRGSSEEIEHWSTKPSSLSQSISLPSERNDPRTFRDPRLNKDNSVEHFSNQSSPSLSNGQRRSSSDSEGKVSDPNSDIDLKHLNMLPLSAFTVTGDVPFHVPVHAPVTVINASITAHPLIPFKPIIVTIPKVSYANITQRMDKNDPRVQEDPRLHRMFYGLEDSAKLLSPKINVEYADPESPVDEISAITPSNSPTSDSRDPRMKKDPRMTDPRSTAARSSGDPYNRDPIVGSANPDPRHNMANNMDHRISDLHNPIDSRVLDPSFSSIANNDPRLESRGDPRLSGQRSDPRLSNRDPRGKMPEDDLPGNIDPRQRVTILGGMPPHIGQHHFPDIGHMGILPHGMPNMMGGQQNGMSMGSSGMSHNMVPHGGLFPPNMAPPSHDMHMGGMPSNPYMPGYVPGHNMLNMMPTMPDHGIMQGINKGYPPVPPHMLPHDTRYGGPTGVRTNAPPNAGDWLPPCNPDPRIKKSMDSQHSFSPPPSLL